MSIASRSRVRAGAVVAALAFVVPAAPAAADGLPLPVEDSPSGVRTLDGATRFLSIALAGRTAVLAQATADGAITGRADLRGRFTIPLVAYDSSAAGISGDGGTLVLIHPRSGFPRRETTFAVMSVKPRLRLRRIVRLHGDFSYDALSPDGSALFLINYISPRDPTRYRVRVYDLARGRLDPAPVVDPREAPGDMSGFAVTRVAGPGGRWAYTLYARPDGTPFIHALDTRDRKAVCIDLDGSAFAGADPSTLRVLPAAGGARLDVRRNGALLATVDTATFRVRDAAAARRAAVRARGGSGAQWQALVGVAVLAAALLGGLVACRRRRAARRPPGAAPSDPLEQEERELVDVR